MPSGARSTRATARARSTRRARAGGRIVAVGTTALRLLEMRGRRGRARSAPFDGATDIFITPGYRFRAVDLLMTNFHLPRSTLFMLVAAFSGLDDDEGAYAHAIASGYRFYSYGDACLLYPRARDERLSLHASHATDGAARTGVIDDAARRNPHAGLHAGRHAGDGEGDVSGAGAGARRRHRARQHLSPDAAARARSAWRGSAGCTTSCAGRIRS